MADQYQGFSNPTIIPEQKYGWQAANQGLSGAIKSASDYLVQQHQKVQDLQYQQAQDLSKFKTLDQIYYGGYHAKQLDDLLSQNPYGKQLVNSTGSLANQGQGDSSSPMGTPGMGASMIGMPGVNNNITGQSMLPMPAGSTGGTSMSPVNPVGGGPVVTSMTQKAFEAPSMTIQNPAGEAAVSSAKEYAGKMAGEMAGAQAGTSKDNQQLAMVTNALKPLVQSYEDVYNDKAGGLPAAGDIYGSGIVKHLDVVPRQFQNSLVKPETQQSAGQFLANKNELVTKLQPLLSQQFGKDGSSRIMESLLNMSQNEIGDLNTPRDQFHGQITGTISSLYRIAKAAQAYKQDLATSGQVADPNTAAQEISSRMKLQNLSPDEQTELQGLIDDTLGNKKQPGGSQNPVMNTQQGSQAKQIDVNTARQLLRQAGGDKDKARQMAKQMGYSF